MMRYLMFCAGANVYEFECEHCGVFGEIEVKPDSQHFFTHQCSSDIAYIQRQPKSIFEKPRLEEFVITRHAYA